MNRCSVLKWHREVDLAVLRLNLRIVMQKPGAVIGSVVLLLAVSLSCSSPTRSTGSEILQQLLDIPSTSFPPETVENASDPGFITATEYLQDLLDQFYFYYRCWVEPFLEEKISPKRIDGALQWQCLREVTTPETVILTVVPGDTLEFYIQRIGSDWPRNMNFMEGRVIPDIEEGFVSVAGNELGWMPTTEGYRLSHIWLLGGWENPITVAVDSTAGGGYLEKYEGLNIRFKANWDKLGHGSWWSYDQGSGEW